MICGRKVPTWYQFCFYGTKRRFPDTSDFVSSFLFKNRGRGGSGQPPPPAVEGVGGGGLGPPPLCVCQSSYETLFEGWIRQSRFSSRFGWLRPSKNRLCMEAICERNMLTRSAVLDYTGKKIFSCSSENRGRGGQRHWGGALLFKLRVGRGGV